ncbi:metal-dependent transcriptional regulator [Picrophilus oshimae]|uniref:Manganese transport regulator n=1 Tax=Picrophilus torridus (strain ATCC 700027 / DSM 9790 / JCM 10055 / NBRC 100828 / KAW 2/3) TaxID=1122961 RepID=Q6KZW9_PICTO|nr:metal-dependent transcriptional regulator [Picrophilus oshimae]AAT43733.1 iron-dependent repressor [Picrophilus oshimae DSM 9789]
MNFKNNLEDYLKEIYNNMDAFGSANESMISKRLKVSMPTVSEYLDKLRNRGLIKSIGRDILLTDRGMKLAYPVIRRHRIAEVMALKIFEVPWEETDSEVMDLEHAINDKYVPYVIKNLGNPDRCPHGNPINPDQKMNDKSIFSVEPGVYTLSRIVYEDISILKKLVEINAFPGTEIKIEKNDKINVICKGYVSFSDKEAMAIRVF